MSQRDLNVNVSLLVPAGIGGSARSRLCPALGGQPKSLPEPDHHRCDPLGTAAGSISRRPGRLATYPSPLCTDGPDSVYGVPSGLRQSIRLVSFLLSSQPLAVTCVPGSSTRGTSKRSSFLPITWMFCE